MPHSTYNLARFDLLSVRLAVLCVQQGSLTKAAQQCHLGLASASRRVHELEDALGGPLFERKARGFAVTAAGRIFFKHGLALLHTLENLNEEISDLQQGVAHHVRLCASTAALNQFLPSLLAAYAKRSPQVRIDLEEQTSHAVTLSLREGRSDVGVFVEGADASDLECRPFRNDELVFILPKGHRLTDKRLLRFSDALDEDWVSLGSGAAMLQQLQQAALAANRPLKLRMQVRSFDAVCHVVASGLGIAVLPKDAAMPVVRALGLAWRPIVDEWAQRRMLIGTPPKPGVAALQLVHFLVDPMNFSKSRHSNKQ